MTTAEETSIRGERQAVLLALLTAVGGCPMFYQKPSTPLANPARTGELDAVHRLVRDAIPARPRHNESLTAG